MEATHADGLLFVVGFIVAASGFIGVVLLANALLSPRRPSQAKGEPFECGLDQAGVPWSAHRIRFSTIAMIFVLFDAEAVLLFAIATRLTGNVVGLLEVGAFVAFLGVGLAYAWRKGALEWLS
jgi:NADH-quinone oxidoreductase subunit A